jgi:S-layer protein
VSTTAVKATSISSAGTTIDNALNGDNVVIADATSFKTAPLTVASCATVEKEVATALSALTAKQIAWFVLGGNTYLLEQAGATNAPFTTADTLVKLTGVLDLSHSTFVASSHTITL